MLQLVVGYMKHPDHNVVTVSLEVLHQMLKHASLPLRLALVSHGDVASLLAQTSHETQSAYGFSFLADSTNGRAIATLLRLSSSVVCDVMYCG